MPAGGGFNAFRAATLRAIVDKISSVGYNFQVDLTWQALQQGFTVAEVPIEFVERERGESKMSRTIVVEALVRTTAWGVRHRVAPLTGLATGLGGKVQQLARGVTSRRAR